MGSLAKVIEISADSEKGFEDALMVGIQQASETLKHVRSVWVKDQEVLVSDGRPKTFRLHLKVTFQVER